MHTFHQSMQQMDCRVVTMETDHATPQPMKVRERVCVCGGGGGGEGRRLVMKTSKVMSSLQRQASTGSLQKLLYTKCVCSPKENL